MEGVFLDTLYSKFDDKITETVSRIVGAAFTDDNIRMIHAIRCLPQKLGGLGMRAHLSVEGAKGRYKSRELALKYITTNIPLLSDFIQQNWLPLPIIDDLLHQQRLEEEAVEKKVDKIIDAYLMRERENLVSMLTISGRETAAAWFESGSTSSCCRWLFWRGGFTRRFQLSSQQLIDCLRMRLLLPPANGLLLPGISTSCSCSRELAPDDAYHFLSCRHTAWFRESRSAMVTRLLKEFVRGVSSTASLTLEPVYACTYGDPIKADLEVRDEHELHVIDVVVVNPARAAPITGLPPEPDYAARQAQTCFGNLGRSEIWLHCICCRSYW